jgi:hypothetical protein
VFAEFHLKEYLFIVSCADMVGTMNISKTGLCRKSLARKDAVAIVFLNECSLYIYSLVMLCRVGWILIILV